MATDSKKELKEQYRQMRPTMGVFIIRSNSGNRYHLEWGQNLRAKMNGARARLAAGMHPNRELQQAWQRQGESAFTIEILETLEYDTDEAKTDYAEDLALLQALCEEKLAQRSMEPYRARLLPPPTASR